MRPGSIPGLNPRLNPGLNPGTGTEAGLPIWPLAADPWDEDEACRIGRIVESGRRTMGEEVAAFERELADFVGARHAVAVNSGSSANLLVVAALRYHSAHRLERGAEVIVPALAWSTTYAPLQQYGLRIRLVDVDALTFNAAADAMLAAVTPDTRAVLAVHALGNPCRTDILRAELPERVVLIEDACDALGAVLDGRYCGTFGLAGTFSTFFSHQITTGEGGVVVTDNDELYHLALVLRAHGWTRDLPAPNALAARGSDAFAERFRFILPGYNLRPTEIQAAAGRAQLRKLPAMLEARRANARRVHAYLNDAPWLVAQRLTGIAAPLAFGLVLGDDAPVGRADLVAALARHGIDSRPILAGNIARTEMMAHLDAEAPDLPGADRLHSFGLMIGNFGHALSYRQIETLTGALRDTCPERYLCR